SPGERASVAFHATGRPAGRNAREACVRFGSRRMGGYHQRPAAVRLYLRSLRMRFPRENVAGAFVAGEDRAVVPMIRENGAWRVDGLASVKAWYVDWCGHRFGATACRCNFDFLRGRGYDSWP